MNVSVLYRLRFSEKTGPTKDLIAAGEGAQDGKDVGVDGTTAGKGEEGGDRDEDHFLKEETWCEGSSGGAQVKLPILQIF